MIDAFIRVCIFVFKIIQLKFRLNFIFYITCFKKLLKFNFIKLINSSEFNFKNI